MRRDYALVTILLLLVIAGVMWWLLRPKHGENPGISSEQPTMESPRPVATVGSSPPARSDDHNEERIAEWKRRKHEDFYFEWKMPINFYGKVVDENNKPVADAIVDFSWTDLSPGGTSRAQTTTDQEGKFALAEQRGKRLQVQVRKDGYYRSQEQSSGNFEYAAFFEKEFYRPDPNNPVRFRLRTKGVAEPLITRQTLYGFVIDGTPQYFDLMTGSKSVGGAATGDIAVRLTRPTAVGRRFDWSFTVEGVGDAGVIESKDELAFVAPTEGYQPRLQYEMKATDPDWKTAVQKSFFVRSRDGKLYARLKADVMAIYNEQAAIDLEVYINPQPGSRNLEFDPSKQTSTR